MYKVVLVVLFIQINRWHWHEYPVAFIKTFQHSSHRQHSVRPIYYIDNIVSKDAGSFIGLFMYMLLSVAFYWFLSGAKLFYGTSCIWYRAYSRRAPSQCEMSLQSNTVSHWLGTNLESALWNMKTQNQSNDIFFTCDWIYLYGWFPKCTSLKLCRRHPCLE